MKPPKENPAAGEAAAGSSRVPKSLNNYYNNVTHLRQPSQPSRITTADQRMALALRHLGLRSILWNLADGDFNDADGIRLQLGLSWGDVVASGYRTAAA